MNIINLTPHEIKIHAVNDGQTAGTVTVPASGQVARVSSIHRLDSESLELYEGLFTDTFHTEYGKIEGLPDFDKKSDNIYIVSSLVLSNLRGGLRLDKFRDDVFAPGNLVRDADGKPVGCYGLKSS